MLLVVVETRPYLVFTSAIHKSTLVGSDDLVNTVDTFLVSDQVIHSSKPFLSPFTTKNVAPEWLLVHEHMLSSSV